ncbi:LCP family protein [Pseudonocardia nigra]|uniref:LCP family protein n=1 Tax=Pseudonocardia nigra TaxID=1921578 RepID=UPI001C5F54C4|nr:LCP family protein [Pseudonocardia nigra]
MEDGRSRARRSPEPGGRRRAREESVDDILARNGLLGAPAPHPGTPPVGGRAARRRAAEELERTRGAAGGHQPPPHVPQAPPWSPGLGQPPSGRRRAPEPPQAAPRTSVPPFPGGAPPGTRPGRRRRAEVPDDAAEGRSGTGGGLPPVPPTGGRRRARDPEDPPAGPAASEPGVRGPAHHRPAAPPPASPQAGPAQAPPLPRGPGAVPPPHHGPGVPPQRPGTARPAPAGAAQPDAAGPVPAPPPRRRHAADPPAPPPSDAPAVRPREDGPVPPRKPARSRAQPPGAVAEHTQRIARAASRRPPAAAEATTRVPAAAPVADPDATTRVRAGEAGVPEEADAPDRSERAERSRRADRLVDAETRAVRIDETLTRLTAAHAGLALATRDGDAPEQAVPVQRRRRPSAVKLVAGALALLVVLTTASGWAAKGWLNGAIPAAAALDLESGAIVDAEAQQGDENVLVVATDPGVAGEQQPRADTVAVAHIPAGVGPVTVLSFPNDLEINRPPCVHWDPATATYSEKIEPAEARTRLVSALDVGGPRCITRVVQQLSGIAITKYVGVDLRAVGAVTEAVGGAQVCVPNPVIDGVLGPVVPEPGTTTLDARRAADFVRAGDVPGEPANDHGRIERQQWLLAAVLDQAVSVPALLDVGQVLSLRPALGDALVTDEVGLDQLLALSRSLRALDTEAVAFAAVPTAREPNSRGNVVLRDTEAAELFAAVREDAPLPEQADDTGPVPADVTVDVFNASDRSGLAGEVGETLRSLGFGVGEVSNADQPTSETVVRFSPDQATAAALLAATVPSATSVPDPGATGVLELVLGRSFDDVVRAPAAPVALQSADPATSGAPDIACA